MKEVWLPVVGYEGLYEVSNWGRVKSLRRLKMNHGKLQIVPERILKPQNNGHDYLLVNLSKNGKAKMCLVHRLVAQAFLPNPNNLPQVNHRNEVKTDNRVENLEWCDAAYNINFGTHNKKVAAAQAKPIQQIDRTTGEVLRIWPSAREVQRQLSFMQHSISECANGNSRYSHAYGYLWRYVN